LKEETKTIRLTIRVTPNARRNELVALSAPAEIRLKLRAPAREGKANAEMLNFLAELLGCRRSELVLLSGDKSRSKVVAVFGYSKENIADRLAAALRKHDSTARS
jgi:uncharacterized protein